MQMIYSLPFVQTKTRLWSINTRNMPEKFSKQELLISINLPEEITLPSPFATRKPAGEAVADGEHSPSTGDSYLHHPKSWIM